MCFNIISILIFSKIRPIDTEENSKLLLPYNLINVSSSATCVLFAMYRYCTHKKADINSVKLDIGKTPTNRHENINPKYNVDENWILVVLKEIVQQAADERIPKNTPQRKTKYVPWINQSIK